jgi:WGR domain-containing protein
LTTATDQPPPPLPKWSRWIRFEQLAPDKNRFREYGITLEQNLLGEWVVSCSWGRIGGPKRVKAKRVKEWYFSSKSEAMVVAERMAYRRLVRGYRVSTFDQSTTLLGKGTQEPREEEQSLLDCGLSPYAGQIVCC